jgi:predicted alpha/beta hydrolase
VSKIIEQESLFLEVEHHSLHVRHLWTASSGPGVLMLHGAIENGRIFYTESGKGLASYLAKQGFNVFVADNRGRGQSIPNIKRDNTHGQHQIITQDIPALIRYIVDLTGGPIHVVCHSWGGVLFASALARYPELREQVVTNVNFGTKRQISVWNLERLFKVSLVWNRLAPFLSRRNGFLDAVKMGIGSDNETHESLLDSVSWVAMSDWVDRVDGFDYGKAAHQIDWPPTWHLTGVKDKVLGHARDVQLFIAESGNRKAKFSNLSTNAGALVNYDHINILTHPKAVHDHFPQVAHWLHSHHS